VAHGASCGLCESGTLQALGAFEGQRTGDVEPGQDVWLCYFVAGQVVFSTQPDIALDESTALAYCDLCEQDMREARGLTSDVPIFVNLVHKT